METVGNKWSNKWNKLEKVGKIIKDVGPQIEKVGNSWKHGQNLSNT